ncbi:MAG TPA: AarF/UbiB family protein [Opitutus sp.]|nr:AarF/UbiB family protein [Opitutus sp.]
MNKYYYTTPLILQKDRPPLEEQPVERPRFSRVFWIGRAVLTLVLRYLSSKVSRKVTPHARAVEVRQLLERMGGIWMKVGQVIAMRTDLFPLEFCSELARLQDRSITFSPRRSMEIVERETGAAIGDTFEYFEEAPFAAASLSQVHKARLRETGEWVVVKVQRPHALDFFHYDYRWLSVFVGLLKFLGIMSHFRLDGMLLEVREMMEEELDYRHEASNMRRLRKILQAHRVIVPAVYLRYTTERVLVMEYLDGVFMCDYNNVVRRDPAKAADWLAENHIDTETVARRLFQSVMRQLYEDLFFHADLHPGNIMLLKGNRLAFIDFGNCGRVDRKLAAQYDQYFRAMSEHALDKAADLLLLTMGKLPPMDVDAFKKKVVKVLGRQITRSHIPNLPYREKSIGSNSAEMNQIMAEFNIEVNWDLLKMARAFEAVDQNLSVLNPDFNFTREMQKYQVAAKRRRQCTQLQQLPNLIDQMSEFSQIILPSMMQRSMNFGGSVGKGIQIFTAIFGLFKKVLIVALLVAVWTYIYQHHHSWIVTLHDEKTDILTEVGLTQLEEKLPKEPPEVWWLGALALAFVIFQIGRFTRKLLRTDTVGPRDR